MSLFVKRIVHCHGKFRVFLFSLSMLSHRQTDKDSHTKEPHLRHCTAFSGPFKIKVLVHVYVFVYLFTRVESSAATKWKKKNLSKSKPLLITAHSESFFFGERSWVSRLLRENMLFSGAHLLSKIYQTAHRKEKKQSKHGPSAAHRSTQRK